MPRNPGKVSEPVISGELPVEEVPRNNDEAPTQRGRTSSISALYYRHCIQPTTQRHHGNGLRKHIRFTRTKGNDTVSARRLPPRATKPRHSPVLAWAMALPPCSPGFHTTVCGEPVLPMRITDPAHGPAIPVQHRNNTHGPLADRRTSPMAVLVVLAGIRLPWHPDMLHPKPTSRAPSTSPTCRYGVQRRPIRHRLTSRVGNGQRHRQRIAGTHLRMRHGNARWVHPSIHGTSPVVSRSNPAHTAHGHR